MLAAIFSPAIGVGRPGTLCSRRVADHRRAGREIWYRWSQQQWKAVRCLDASSPDGSWRTNDKQIIAFMNQGKGCTSPPSAASSMTSRASDAWGVNAPLEWFHQDKKYVP